MRGIFLSYWLLDLSCIDYRKRPRGKNSPRYRPHSTAFPIPIWSNAGCVTSLPICP
ncbi:hypothetical protein BCR44DRAFT_1444463 [Catenaria anguillulae PL171]|uniref:Uncharacterized protein n=1 Tax=Catenaria anguillulae PL171 TaxID=765915 RepID=A0A1Y2H7T0_9FUNG|nr:hypothetical protein BCR44DRAFT_1444437 [Catenaria anguillulae PL171]ORZ30624.1 hypothetical protein BCR44DRAFT_1444463 [Catenaria anguillulae PL171]